MVVRSRSHHDEPRPVRTFAHHRLPDRPRDLPLGDPGRSPFEPRHHRPGGDRGGFAHQRLLRRRLDHPQPPQERRRIDEFDALETGPQRLKLELGHAQALLVSELHAESAPVEPELVQAVEQRIEPAAGLRVTADVAHRAGALHLRGEKGVRDQHRLAPRADDFEERAGEQRQGAW